MYEELVKQCRDCLDSLCGECKYEHLQKAGNFVPCMNALLGEAADAIEELSNMTEERVEKIMEAVCDLCHWPYVYRDEQIMQDEKCICCPVEKALREKMEGEA